METAAVDGVEQQHADQAEKQHKQVGVQVPQIGHDHVADFCQGGNLGEDLLVGEAVDDCANQETQEAGDQIIELSFAATGGASARSVPGEGHAHAEDQPSDKVPDDIG